MDCGLRIPPGFRFEPSDEDVIQFYLKMKLNGESAPWDYVIKDYNIYGDKSPWDILREFGEEKSVWVFTKRKRVKSRFSRVAGCGTWRSDQAGIEVKDNMNNVIGLKVTYSFRIADEKKNQCCSSNDKNKKKERWMMYEYSLGRESDFAICKIKKVDGGKGEDKSSVAKIRKAVKKRGQGKEEEKSYTGEMIKETSYEFGGVQQQQSSSFDDIFDRIPDMAVDNIQNDLSMENLDFELANYDFGEIDWWKELFPEEVDLMVTN